MSTQYQDVKRKIAHRLLDMDGWTVYGYRADKSDSMTDYYRPAYWGGIATKNGYTLVIDKGSAAKEERRTITIRAAESAEASEKIKKLEAITQERGASEQEEQTARKKVEILRAKDEAGTTTKEIYAPGHLANPPRCNWHIEKDGIIYDKGTGLLKFSDVPDISGYGYGWERNNWQEFNNKTPEEWKADYIKDIKSLWNYTDDDAASAANSAYNDATKKYALLGKFNELIARFNNVCGGLVGNTEETYTYEEITKTEYKKEIKPQETATGSIKDGQLFVVKSYGFNYEICAGYVYRIHAHEGAEGKTYFTAVRLNGKCTKELTGTANRANFWGYIANDKDINRFNKWIEHGALAWCELVEVSTPYKVKKVVKKKIEQSKAAKEEPEKEPETMNEKKINENDPVNVGTSFEDNTGEAPQKPQESPEPDTAEEVPTAEENAPKTDEDEAQTEEPAPDMFAELAKAYITGKNAPKAKKEPPNAEEPQKVGAEKPEEEPKPEAPHVPGYFGNDNARFTPEEREKLGNGGQIESGDGREKILYFTANYSCLVKFVYRLHMGNRDRISAGSAANYAGFMIDDDFYSNVKPIQEKLSEDVNRRLLEMVSDETSAAHAAANVDGWEREKIENAKEYGRTEEARRLFYEGKKPSLTLYRNTDIDTGDIIKYLINPVETIEQYALDYMSREAARIYIDWITYNKTLTKYNEIVTDTDNNEHKLLKISRSVSNEKSVRVELANGHTVKVEASAVKDITYSGSIYRSRIASGDRQHLIKHEGGYSGEILPDDIVAIYHGGRELYRAT